MPHRPHSGNRQPMELHTEYQYKHQRQPEAGNRPEKYGYYPAYMVNHTVPVGSNIKTYWNGYHKSNTEGGNTQCQSIGNLTQDHLPNREIVYV